MIRIVTDSGCDLPDEMITGHHIVVVPLSVSFGETDYVDREDLSIDEFWELLTGSDEFPQTAAPPVGRFTETFEALAAEGADGIVVVCMSSAISATYRAATLAAEAFDEIPVRVIDSRLVSGALGLAVLETAEAGLGGASLDRVSAVAADASERINLYAALDTLEYLRRGGRIGAAQALLGSLLDVKPIISFDVGEVSPAGKVRTRKRALATVLEHLRELDDRVVRLGVIHSDPPDLEEFLDMVAEVHGTRPQVMRIGPIVGSHAGPGVAGIVYRLA
jgi:DegV family protein with EDD domain